jgi:hypothetical protein
MQRWLRSGAPSDCPKLRTNYCFVKPDDAAKSPDALADALLRADLGDDSGDVESALARLASLRAGLPKIDGMALTREARDELERRSA